MTKHAKRAEQMKTVVEKLIAQKGIGCEVEVGELGALLEEEYPDFPEGSVLPQDYCYDRVNKDRQSTSNPRLFKLVRRGVYACLGENYPYGEPMYTFPKDTGEKIHVGNWENGFFTPNENWEKCGLKEPTFKNVKK